jgi:hypothetical protein
VYSIGWLDMKLIVFPVIVCLQYTSISNWLVFLMMIKSRKLIWLLASSVGVSCRLLCMELACYAVVSGSVQLAS